MTSFEILTTVLSSLAIIISLPTFIISIIKIINGNKNYKKRFIIDTLEKLRDSLNKELSILDDLNPAINMGLIFKKIENSECFDYYSEILKLYNSVSVVVSNALILLSSYKATECSVKTIEILKEISEDMGNCLKIVVNNKEKKAIINEYVSYEHKRGVQSYRNFRYNIIIELTNVINHFMKDKVTNDEMDKYFVQLSFSNKI